MKTIRSRRRLIRIEMIVLVTLAVMLIFPSGTKKAWNEVVRGPVYERGMALFEEAYARRQLARGDQKMAIRLAWGYSTDWDYHRYMKGDAETILQPLIDAKSPDAMRLLALILRKSDPERAREFFLRAAERGDTVSQHFVMDEIGLDPNDADSYLRGLYALQLERPGWRRLFNHTYRLLQDQAQAGNEIAAQALSSLTEFVETTA